MVERQLPKLIVRVRFPSPAPARNPRSGRYHYFRPMKTPSRPSGSVPVTGQFVRCWLGSRSEPGPRHNSAVAVRVDESLAGIDWAQAKADLAADNFDNGRSAQALRASFERSQHVVIARDGERVVGMARMLSDGVCNAYLLDVWTKSTYRRRGIGAAMVRQLMSRVPGQHVGLQTDDAEAFYASLGYRHQPVFMSAIVGEWLVNELNATLGLGAAPP